MIVQPGWQGTPGLMFPFDFASNLPNKPEYHPFESDKVTENLGFNTILEAYMAVYNDFLALALEVRDYDALARLGEAAAVAKHLPERRTAARRKRKSDEAWAKAEAAEKERQYQLVLESRKRRKEAAN